MTTTCTVCFVERQLGDPGVGRRWVVCVHPNRPLVVTIGLATITPSPRIRYVNTSMDTAITDASRIGPHLVDTFNKATILGSIFDEVEFSFPRDEWDEQQKEPHE